MIISIVLIFVLVTVILFFVHWYHAGMYANGRKMIITDAIVKSITDKQRMYPTVMPKWYILQHEALRTLVVCVAVGVPYVLSYHLTYWWYLLSVGAWGFLVLIGLYAFIIHIADIWRHGGPLTQELYLLLAIVCELLLWVIEIERMEFVQKYIQGNIYYRVLLGIGVFICVLLQLIIWKKIPRYIWRTRTSIYNTTNKRRT